jgi:hypothetical protein
MLPKSLFAWILFLASFVFIFTITVSAHCDSMEGPVVKASQKALESGNINYVLIWVRADDEKEIKNLFNKVLQVRKLTAESKEIADMYFFETVVRVHRMGEGEGYSGLKPVGYKPEKGIELADVAVEANSIEKLLTGLDKKHHSKIKGYFAGLQSKKNYSVNDVKAGREYVESYVRFIHSVETLYGGGENKSKVHNHNKK